MAAEPRSETKSTKPSIGLVMIVKDEAENLRACVDAARPIIDSLTILDTGSTDDTQKIARELITEIGRGHLTRSKTPWQGFGPARTKALQFGRKSGSKYLLMLDADHRLHIDGRKKRRLASLDKDIYTIRVRGGMEWKLALLTRAEHACDYRGVAHSYLHSINGTASEGDVSDILSIDGGPGPSREKIERDLPLLQAAAEADPSDRRTVFYLAQTYRDLDRDAEAAATYRRRARMRGWDQEVYWSLYMEGLIRSWNDWNRAVPILLEAWDYRPSRAEPLYVLARGYAKLGYPRLAEHFVALGREIPLPEDSLFVLRWMYDPELWDALLATEEAHA